MRSVLGALEAHVLAGTLAQPGHHITVFPHTPLDAERQMFDALCHAVLPRMQGQFCGGFWHTVIPRASRAYPAVWHAALAVTAVQLRHTMDDFPVRQCSKAIKCMMKVQAHSPTPGDAEQEMLLITCLLLTKYCSLQGRPKDAMIHIQNGLALLKQWRYGIADDAWGTDNCLPNCVAPAAPVLHQFMKLENQLLSSPDGNSLQCKSICDLYWPRRKDSYLPSAEIAFTQIIAILNMHGQVIDMPHLIIGPPPPLATRADLFKSWQKAFRDLERRSLSKEPDTDLRVVQTWELCCAILCELGATGTWGPHTGAMDRIVDIAGEVLKYDGSKMALLGELLQMVALWCEDQYVRQKAVVLLSTHPYRDGIFDSDAAVQRSVVAVRTKNLPSCATFLAA